MGSQTTLQNIKYTQAHRAAQSKREFTCGISKAFMMAEKE